MNEAGKLDPAIDSFAMGVACGRGFTFPSQIERVGRLWVIRDAPRKRAVDYRREEWAAHGEDPAEVDATARKLSRGRFCICAFHAADESDAPLRSAYNALGYRLQTTEAFMVHHLAKIAKFSFPYPIHRVATPELADRVAKSSGRRQILPEHLASNDALRLYVALDGDQPVGWLRSIVTGERNWVSNVYTVPKYRRRGIGKSLLVNMLRDDRKYGSQQAVLTASQAGVPLYESVGFAHLGKLLLFTPKR
jgi:GNAT superfamily N-acetyltransferase